MNRHGLRALGTDNAQQSSVPLNHWIARRRRRTVLRERFTGKSSREHGADDQSKYLSHRDSP
jgi:hypothetical protein